jgi:hypothetical protein
VRFAIDIVSTAIWLPLELLVIAALLRGEYRRFPLILAYTVAEFLATAAELPAYWAVYRGVKNATTQRTWLYSLDEVVLQALMYALVFSLLYQATEHLKTRRILRIAVIFGAVTFASASFWIHYIGPHDSIGSWLTPWTRDLSFCSAILDMALWTLLISSRAKDRKLLLVSGGLGIRFTGEAIGESLRQLASQRRSRPISYAGGLLVAIVDILCVFIWWQAFREKAPAKLPAPAS